MDAKMPNPWTLIVAGRLTQAFETLSGLIKKEPGHVHYNHRALIHLLQKNYQGASNDLGMSLAHLQKKYWSSSTLIELGIAQFCQGHHDFAIKFWKQACAAPYTDAAGGVEGPAILLYAGLRLQRKELVKFATKMMRTMASKHNRRMGRLKNGSPKSKVTQVLHPGLQAWPGAIIPLHLGQMDVQKFKEIASRSAYARILLARHQCQANFHLAVWFLRQDDMPNFKRHIIRCAKNKHGLLEWEYYVAQFEMDQK